MATCPLCEAQLDSDFGLVECSGCGAQLIMHVDGRLEYQGEPLMADVVEEASPAVEGYGDPPPLPESVEGEEEYLADEDEAAPVEAESVEAEANSRASSTPAPTPEYSFDDDGPVDPPPPAYVTAASPDSPDMSDIANFGNSDISGSRDGSLRYTLTIDGIDTSDVRNAFREAITDRKLMWDIETILRSVRNGQVTIQNVSPSKAFMVISRLRSLPVRVQWEQYAVQQT